MATPIGTNVVTTIGRQYMMPEFTDNVYGNNVVFFRLNSANKRTLQGGTQIEMPLMYDRFSNGGSYRGFDVLNVAPSDTVKAAAWDWKQFYVPVTIDSLTLIKVNSAEAIADLIALYFAQAELEMAANLGASMWQTGTDAKGIDSIEIAVDSSDPPAAMGNYGGLSRSSNTWWASTEDAATTTLTEPALNTMFQTLRKGGRTTTLLVSTATNYNRFWNLQVAKTTIQQVASLRDDTLAAAGFQNIQFNGVPWVIDDNISSANSLFFLNEEYMWLAVSSKSDFTLQDFIKPHNQDAMTSLITWAGNLVVTNCARQGKMTGLTA